MIPADTTTRLTLTNLRVITTHWGDLHHALATTGTATWPPAGRMNDYLASIDRRTEDEVEAATWQARALRDLERSPSQIGETRAPIRLRLLDVMTAVEADLVELADQIAAVVQRSPMSHAPREWPATDRARRDQLAREDAADPRRWRYVGTRSGRFAAAWLLARVQGLPGPFERLTDGQLDRIATVAASAAQRVEQALDMADHKATLTRPCPDCSGELLIEAGGGERPAVWCGRCGRTWHEPEPSAA